ncbi:hypothetical protein AAE478_003762 [Parahypoxylon ruwenzoriense]
MDGEEMYSRRAGAGNDQGDSNRHACDNTRLANGALYYSPSYNYNISLDSGLTSMMRQEEQSSTLRELAKRLMQYATQPSSLPSAIPEGLLLRPPKGAAVCVGNVLTSQRVVDVILRAFAATAASQGCMKSFVAVANGTVDTIQSMGESA